MAEVEMLLQQVPEQQAFASLPQSHPLRALGRQIETLAAQSAAQASHSDDLILQFSQRVVHALFKTATQVGRDFYTAMLERLCRQSEPVAKEALSWLLFADDEVSCVSSLTENMALNSTTAQVQRASYCHSSSGESATSG
jgi:CCR4-NOT transcription complex subunit 1